MIFAKRSQSTRWYELRRTIGAVHVHIKSDTPRFVDDLATLYPSTAACSDSGPTVRMEIRKSRSRFGTSAYRVFGDGDQVGGEHRRREVFPYLEWGINLGVIAQYSRFVQLHAASLSHGGHGFIFAGASGIGKSTLAAGLLTRGWQYFCDEFALIERDTKNLHSFPKALCIKSGSLLALRRLGVPFARAGDHIKANKGRVRYINPHAIRSNCIADPAPVRYVIFPEYIAGAPPRLHRVSRAQALIDLAACVFNRHVFPHYALDVLSSVIQGAQCYRLDVGAPDATADLLEKALCHGQTRAEATTDHDMVSTIRSSRPVTRSRRVNPSRRDLLRRGAKLAYVAPVVLTLTAQEAFGGASVPSGACSTGVQTGGLCNTDTDCCSGDCDLGVCQ